MSMVRVHPRLPLFHTRASFNGSGYPATNRETGGSNPPARTIRLVVQWRGRSPPKAEIPVRPRTGRPIQERRPAGEAPGCRPGTDEFDSRTLRQLYGDVDKWLKSPALQAGYRGFESRHRCHWPEAHEDEQTILNRPAASSILARPTKFL